MTHPEKYSGRLPCRRPRQLLVEVSEHNKGNCEGYDIGDYLRPEHAVDGEEVVHNEEKRDIYKPLAAGG